MGEQGQVTPDRTQRDTTGSYAALQEQVQLYAGLTPDGKLRAPDTYMRSCYGMLSEVLESPEEFPNVTNLIRINLDTYPDRPTIYQANILPRLLQAELRRDGEVARHFPEDFDQPAAWRTACEQLETNNNARERFTRHSEWGVSTTLPERALLPMLAAQLYGVTGRTSMVDLGASRLHVLKTFDLYRRLQLTPPAVLRRTPEGEPGDIDPALSYRVSQMLGKLPFRVDKRLAIDREDPLVGRSSRQSPQAAESIARVRWGENLLYSSELGPNSPRRANYWRLESYTPSQHPIRFYQRDLVNFDVAAYRRSYSPKHIGLLSLVLYQMSADDAQEVLDMAPKLLHPRGLLIVQDFCQIEKDGTLHLSSNWEPWSFGVHVFDKSQPKKGFQKLFSGINGRAEQIMLEPAALGRLAMGHAVSK